MFSASENIQLRQHKKRVVAFVEDCIPDDVLDLGVNVMVMQVSCKAPGCVPLETAIIIIFPKSGNELLVGLPESKGGNYKTKVLKPLSQVVKEDVLEALPPAFTGGLRSVEKLCLQARDVMLGQITQLFPEDDVEGRRLMVEYLQESLQQYIDRDCVPPEWGEAFPAKVADATNQSVIDNTETDTQPATAVDNSTDTTAQTIGTVPTPADSVSRRRQQHAVVAQLDRPSSAFSRLEAREHAPGTRRFGCPCW
jgi:hypothetical protein